MIDAYRIPKAYYQDHVDCGCEAPAILKETKQHYWISTEENTDLAELRSRAQYYIDMGAVGGFDPWFSGLIGSAKATIKIIGNQPVIENQTPKDCYGVT